METSIVHGTVSKPAPRTYIHPERCGDGRQVTGTGIKAFPLAKAIGSPRLHPVSIPPRLLSFEKD
jgi:hypothetical protein